MKKTFHRFLIAAALVTLTGSLHAETYSIDLNRFGRLVLDTDAKKVTIVQGSKSEEDEVRFESKITAAGRNSFTTPSGVKFTVRELAEAFIRDANRGINSGKWSVTVSGEGGEYAKVLATIKEMTGFDENVVYGDKLK
jgi:hypothetical protein